MDIMHQLVSTLFHIIFWVSVVGTFFFLSAILFNLIDEADSGALKIRCTIAASVPILSASFWFVSTSNSTAPLVNFVASFGPIAQAIIGGVIGLVITELIYAKNESSQLAPFVSLVISGLCVFLLLMFSGGILMSLKAMLFGALIVTALYISLVRGWD